MSFRTVVQSVVAAPWATRRRHPKRDSVVDTPNNPDVDPEIQVQRPLLKIDVQGHGQGPSASYGATDRSRISSPEGHRRGSLLGRVPEEDQIPEDSAELEETDELEQELQEQDLYSGESSHTHIIHER